MNKESLKKHFQANMLDGDKIQNGQMLSSESVFEYVTELLALIESEKKAFVEYVIGEDENDPNRNARWQAYRNELRSEQRKRAGL